MIVRVSNCGGGTKVVVRIWKLVTVEAGRVDVICSVDVTVTPLPIVVVRRFVETTVLPGMREVTVLVTSKLLAG